MKYVTTLNTSVLAISLTLASSTVVQASDVRNTFEITQLLDQCRQVKREVLVYQNPASDSPTVGSLAQGTEVQLAQDEVVDGWIAIREPGEGFLQTADLASCGLYSVPESSGLIREACVNYQVSQDNGLEVYALNDRRSNVLDYVFPTEKIRFNQMLESGGLEWLQIIAPVDGWIENGLVNSDTQNTSPCGDLGISYRY